MPALGTWGNQRGADAAHGSAGTLPGSYWVIAIADWRTAITESAESNNTRTYSFRVGPDLIVNTVTAPTSAVAGTTISVTDMTWNQGGDTAPASGTAYYLSRTEPSTRETYARHAHGSIVGAGDQPVRICLSRDSRIDCRRHVHSSSRRVMGTTR